MSELGKFYKKGELDASIIVPAYQEAFSGWPWFEVSKCVDPSKQQRCAGSLSRIAVNEMCTTCGLKPTQPAYEPDELIERFNMLESTRPTSWYMEAVDENPALVALAWSAAPEQIAIEKYGDVPAMQDWLTSTLPNEPIIWLDEVFADKQVRASGNLVNFRSMCTGFMSALNNTELAYRTISPAMLRAAEKGFQVTPSKDTPDRRAFITLGGESV
jgi:hypothetical protein